MKILFLFVFVSINLFAAKVDTLKVYLNPELLGSFSGTVKIKAKGLSISKKEVVIPRIDAKAQFVQKLEKEINAGSILADLVFYTPSEFDRVELDDDSFVIETVKIKIGDAQGSYPAMFSSIKQKRPKLSKKVKEINCSNQIQATVESNVLILDLRAVKTLAGCASMAVFNPENVKNLEGYLNPARNRKGKNRNKYSIEDDITIGGEYAAQLDEEYKKEGILLTPENDEMAAYLQKQMEKIASVAGPVEGVVITPKVRVINANILNAFALPGGHVFVYKGLLDSAESEAAIMGVLGHEWAHVTHRHGTKGVSRANRIIIPMYAGAIVGAIISETSKNWKAKLAGNLLSLSSIFVGYTTIMGQGREAEREADLAGAKYAYHAGFHPTGIADMFTTFSKKSPKTPSKLEKLFSSHPSHDERISSNKRNVGSVFELKEDFIFETTSDFRTAYASMPQMPDSSDAATDKVAEALVSKLEEMSGAFLMKDQFMKDILESKN